MFCEENIFLNDKFEIECVNSSSSKFKKKNELYLNKITNPTDLEKLEFPDNITDFLWGIKNKDINFLAIVGKGNQVNDTKKVLLKYGIHIWNIRYFFEDNIGDNLEYIIFNNLQYKLNTNEYNFKIDYIDLNTVIYCHCT